MQLRIKATGFKLTAGLKIIAEEKLLAPLEKRMGREFGPEHILDVELAKTTQHHEEGRIWKCEVNLALPHETRTLYAQALSESLEAAIDEAKDELEREVREYKGKRASKFLRSARKLKEYFHFTRLARSAGGLYRWIRRK
ncbi:MAG: HPF/RaiA family ribosome-associated protein [Patescibacteria group bacterium]